VRVIGVPFNSAGIPEGVARAPGALREAGLIARLHRPGRTSNPSPDPDPTRSFPTRAGEVRDAGDVDVGVLRPERDPDCRLRALESLHVTTASVRRAVAASVHDGDRPLVIGGDCPVLLGCLRGTSDAVGEVGLLFIDGHQDAWPPDRSTTGEAADCELGFILGLHRERLPPSLTHLLPTLDPRQVVALGPRDADDLAAHAVASVTDRIFIRPAEDFHTDADVAAAAADATARILRRVEHWWLHIDLDVLSTDALPAVDYPQPGGLSWSQLESLTATALGAAGCVGITVCIYNPDLDPDRRHARRIVDYLAHLCAPLSPRKQGV